MARKRMFPKVCKQIRGDCTLLFIYVPEIEDGRKVYKKIYLGAEGSKKAEKKLKSLQREWSTKECISIPKPHPAVGSVSVSALAREFMVWCRTDYSPTSREPTKYYAVLKSLVEYCGKIPVESFSLQLLEDFRMSLVDRGTMCRKEINARITRVKKCFKWGARRKLVPLSVLTEIQLVESIRRGRGGTKENPPVKAVPMEDVIKTLPFLSSQVASMVKLQLITGARPEEIRIMRPCDLDRRDHDGCWWYMPAHDKTERFRDGEKKIIPLNRAAINIVLKHSITLSDSSTEYIFRPADALAEIRAERARNRKTPIQPSQRARNAARKKDPKEKLNPCYTASAYRNAIRRAAEKAGVSHWYPYQLRHTSATEIQRALGIEAAQTLLQHKSQTTTQIYVDADKSDADRLATKILDVIQFE